MQASLILDFDSTFVGVEALDELAKIVLTDNPRQVELVRQIERLTDDGMTGKIAFSESLSRRLALFSPARHHIDSLMERLEASVTPSVDRNRDFFARYFEHVYIVSGGFREYIVPVVRQYGIPADHVYGNTFNYDGTGRIIGCDTSAALSQDHGKARMLSELRLPGPTIMVGDGASDLDARVRGAADAFVAFTENIDRPGVTLRADHIARTFDDVVRLFENLVPKARTAQP